MPYQKLSIVYYNRALVVYCFNNLNYARSIKGQCAIANFLSCMSHYSMAHLELSIGLQKCRGRAVAGPIDLQFVLVCSVWLN